VLITSQFVCFDKKNHLPEEEAMEYGKADSRPEKNQWSKCPGVQYKYKICYPLPYSKGWVLSTKSVKDQINPH